MTKLQRIQLSLALSAATGAYVAIIAGMRMAENILAGSTASCGVGMLLGSLAALSRRTWGVGLVFAAAVAFATAGAMGMGPPVFFVFAAAGALPMLLGAKPFARFDRGAALLFAGIAVALGVGSALAWHELWPALWQLAYAR
jgi:hypothetical protein